MEVERPRDEDCGRIRDTLEGVGERSADDDPVARWCIGKEGVRPTHPPLLLLLTDNRLHCRLEKWHAVFAKRFEQALRTADPNPPPTATPDQEDPDTWLDIDPEGLEQMLKERGGEGATTIEDVQAEQLGGIADKFQKFVQGKGSLEGALFEE
jgi:hypothetical protein